MPRQVRIEYPGAAYHVMCRGDRREAIFEDDQDPGSPPPVLPELIRESKSSVWDTPSASGIGPALVTPKTHSASPVASASASATSLTLLLAE